MALTDTFWSFEYQHPPAHSSLKFPAPQPLSIPGENQNSDRDIIPEFQLYTRIYLYTRTDTKTNLSTRLSFVRLITKSCNVSVQWTQSERDSRTGPLMNPAQARVSFCFWTHLRIPMFAICFGFSVCFGKLIPDVDFSRSLAVVMRAFRVTLFNETLIRKIQFFR